MDVRPTATAADDFTISIISGVVDHNNEYDDHPHHHNRILSSRQRRPNRGSMFLERQRQTLPQQQPTSIITPSSFVTISQRRRPRSNQLSSTTSASFSSSTSSSLHNLNHYHHLRRRRRLRRSSCTSSASSFADLNNNNNNNNKSTILPQISKMRSLLFFSLHLLVFFLIVGNGVPIALCAQAAALSSGGSGGPSSLIGHGSSSFNRRSSEPTTSLSSSSSASSGLAASSGSDIKSIFGPLIPTDSSAHRDDMKCLFYNRTTCEQTNTGCGETYQLCRPQAHSHEPDSLCYALWRNTSATGVVIESKGCWLGLSKDCVATEPHLVGADERQCVQTQSPNRKGLYFCCCSGMNCNENVKHIPPPPKSSSASPDPPSISEGSSAASHRFSNPLTLYLILGVGVFFLVGVFSLTVILFGKFCRKPTSANTPSNEPLLDWSGPTGYTGQNPISLQEIRAQGKFGSVWLAKDGDGKVVAVKVFNVKDRSSWQTEKDVYSLPQMKHKNILNYYGAERYGEGLDVQYWLITEYHPNGSLWDYLKSHTITVQQLLVIIQGIGAGLTHLHEEFPASVNEAAKLSVAHRDFKSKNVLLSNNLRPCIADFGLAIVFLPNSIGGDALGQVGTRRYMAPEVLEGAINFNRDSFLRIDMYACGLVLWELMSRCKFGDIVPNEYRLPFEEEVGTFPSLEDMQDVVSQQKKRPRMLDAWLKHPTLALVAQTVQDCWDQDAEARISASTICERIQSLTNEDNCLSLNNVNGTVTYGPLIGSNNASTVAPTATAASTIFNGISKASNTFMMTAAHQQHHQFPHHNQHHHQHQHQHHNLNFSSHPNYMPQNDSIAANTNPVTMNGFIQSLRETSA